MPGTDASNKSAQGRLVADTAENGHFLTNSSNTSFPSFPAGVLKLVQVQHIIRTQTLDGLNNL